MTGGMFPSAGKGDKPGSTRPQSWDGSGVCLEWGAPDLLEAVDFEGGLLHMPPCFFEWWPRALGGFAPNPVQFCCHPLSSIGSQPGS